MSASVSSPLVSIIIPTHNRARLLPRTLGALKRQTAPPSSFEVILVADGCSDETGRVAQEMKLQLPFPIRIFEQPLSGAAVARNRGADDAQGQILLFLDDDMEASVNLVEAHREAHQRAPGGVVLGYFYSADLLEPDFVSAAVKLWWNDHFAELSKNSHRFSFKDFCTGNVSLPSPLFRSMGGFNEEFGQRAGEDYEIGIRLLKQGIKFQFEPRAISIHHDLPTLNRALRRAYAEGQGHITIVRQHPEVFTELPLTHAFAGAPWVKSTTLYRNRQWVIYNLPKVARLPLTVTEWARARRAWKQVFGLVHSCCYWQGVAAELGGLHRVRRFIADLPLLREDIRYGEINLALDLNQLDEKLVVAQMDAVGIRYQDHPVGWLWPVPGVEPVRASHVRSAIVDWFGEALLIAMRRSQFSGLQSDLKLEPQRIELTEQNLYDVDH